MQRATSKFLKQGTLRSAIRLTSSMKEPHLTCQGTKPPNVHIAKFDITGHYQSEVIRKNELLSLYGLQPRDIRFSAPSSLYLRKYSIILRLEHIKAIINSNELILMETDHKSIKGLLPELQARLQVTGDGLPYELKVIEILFTETFSLLETKFERLDAYITGVLNDLLDSNLLSIDKGSLHGLMYHSSSLSELNSLVKDIQETLSDLLDCEEDMASFYLTHYIDYGEERDQNNTEELCNILESFYMETEDMLGRVKRLKEQIDQSQNIVLINLDSQRNIMLRMSLQLGMGTFSLTLGGLMGVAFGMNLDSSLEENLYAFWIVSGAMVGITGVMWRRLSNYLKKSLYTRTMFTFNSKNIN